MGKSLYEFGKEISYLMPRFMREVLKRQARALSKGDITIPQMIILNLLKEKGLCMMSEIAKALSVTTSAATGMVERMVKSNLVKRVSHEKDRRVINIEITNKGRKIIDDIQKLRYKMMMDIFSKLTAIERERYLETIKKIYCIMSEDNR